MNPSPARLFILQGTFDSLGQLCEDVPPPPDRRQDEATVTRGGAVW